MSTNINISVGGNSLVDQAKAQQQASRQAQLEKEARQRLERQAQIERVNALAAQGKDANGNLITGTPRAPQSRPDEPAAFRSGDPYFFMLGPTAAPTPSVLVSPIVGVYGEDKYAATTRVEPAFDFQEVWLNTVPPFNTPSDNIFSEFKSGMGPSGLNAVMFNTTNSTSAASYVLEMAYESKYNETSGQQNPFLKSKQLNTQDYTSEIYLRLDQRSGTSVDTLIRFEVVSRENIDPRKRILLQLNYQRTMSAPACTFSYIDSEDSNNTFTSGALSQTGYQFGTWLHLAVCRKSDTVRFFIGGINVYQTQKPVTTAVTAYDVSAAITIQITRGSNNSQVPSSPWFSRAKYSQRALYTSNFTPPTTW